MKTNILKSLNKRELIIIGISIAIGIFLGAVFFRSYRKKKGIH